MEIPKTCKAFVVETSGAPGKLKDIPVPSPKRDEVLIKVHACGICNGDAVMMSGVLGDMVTHPFIPGHEIVGTVVALGEGKATWKIGDLVGGAYHGGHDGTCKSCRMGFFQTCQNQVVNGMTKMGGYTEYTILRMEAVIRLPPHMDKASIAPLMCAGVTMFNGIRQTNTKAGGLVAVQGLGGLGHLGVQYARKMGFRTVALSRGEAKRDFAKELGAHEYIDTEAEDPVKRLLDMGGADLIAVTAPGGALISKLVHALAPKGKLLSLSAMDDIPINMLSLMLKGASVVGWPSGSALDSEEAVQFADLQGVNCLIERFRLDQVQEAVERMTSGNVRFRSVLVMD